MTKIDMIATSQLLIKQPDVAVKHPNSPAPQPNPASDPTAKQAKRKNQRREAPAASPAARTIAAGSFGKYWRVASGFGLVVETQPDVSEVNLAEVACGTAEANGESRPNGGLFGLSSWSYQRYNVIT
jgi:pyruvate/2-oxoglutarate dehydrogenase complex dihydrolipoamide acyltransferase (E2) component